MLDDSKDKSWDNKEAEKGKHQKSGYLSAKIVQCLMTLKTKAGITRKQTIAEHQQSGYFSALLVLYLMAGIKRKQKIAEHQK